MDRHLRQIRADITISGGGLDKFVVDYCPVLDGSSYLDPVTGKAVLENEGGEFRSIPGNRYFRLTNQSGSIISCGVLSVEAGKVRLVKGDDLKGYTVPLAFLSARSRKELAGFRAD